jgi:hypothetical protein
MAVPPLEPLPAPKDATLSTAAKTLAPLKTMEIEVDDDEDDDGLEFVMPPVRLTSRFGART